MEKEFIFDTNNLIPNPREQNNSHNCSDDAPIQYLKKIIDSSEITDLERRIAQKFINAYELRDSSSKKYQIEISDIDFLDDDMFLAGKINNNVLTINICSAEFKICLAKTIRNAFAMRNSEIIRTMLRNKADLHRIEPNIMIMCVEKEMDDLLIDLLDARIPIHSQEYRCVFESASKGKLDIIKKIVENYKFHSLPNIIGKICAQAIANGHLHILEYFCSPETFEQAPDIVFAFFINTIQYSGQHLHIIKYFIENGISIKQENYTPIKKALQYKRGNILKYFYEIDSKSIDHVLTNEEKELYGLQQVVTIKKWINNDILCSIMASEFVEGDFYFKCNNQQETHYFGKEVWGEWIKKNNNWKCPRCFSNVQNIIYHNVRED